MLRGFMGLTWDSGPDMGLTSKSQDFPAKKHLSEFYGYLADGASKVTPLIRLNALPLSKSPFRVHRCHPWGKRPIIDGSIPGKSLLKVPSFPPWEGTLSGNLRLQTLTPS